VTSASREAAAQRFLLDQGLQAAGEQASWIPLVGGVSSDLWLLLARVDGASPVEYLVEEADQARVRAAATALLTTPAGGIAEALGRLAVMHSSPRAAHH
jgi:hypothetical protein